MENQQEEAMQNIWIYTKEPKFICWIQKFRFCKRTKHTCTNWKCNFKRYGNELASEVISNLAELIKLENSHNSNAQYEQAIKTQQTFLKCIEKDIDSLNSKKDVEEYINIYRGYKLNNLVR